MAEPQSPTHPKCFDREVLADFTLGRLPMAELKRIGSELETCPKCQAVLDTLDALEDSVAADLRSGASEPSGPISDELEDQLREAEELSRVIWGRRPGDEDEPDDTPPPRQLGQYEVAGRIGRGGMGTVYRGFHPRLKRPVAIKVLPGHRLRDPQAVARFEREMEAVGNLDHSNLVRAHDAGEFDGQHYLVMELLDGLDLSRAVRRHGPLPVPEACEIVRQAALGLHHAHEHGLVHRDVKPSNLMLTSDGFVKVLDLGLARLDESESGEDRTTGTDQVMGTGDFMAPEQADNAHNVDRRTDIYALGCTLYHLLTGRPPFGDSAHPTLVKKLLAHASEPVPPIHKHRPDVPESVSAILEQMLEKDPVRRFQTAADIAEAIAPLAAEANLQPLAKELVEAQSAEDVQGGETPSMSCPEAVTGASARPRPQPQSTAAAGRPRVRLILLGLLFGGIVLAALIIRLRTQRGELIIRSPAPDVEVRLSQSGDELALLSGKTEYRVPLGPGGYQIQVSKGKTEYGVSSPTVEIVGGEAVTVTIESRSGDSHADAPKDTPDDATEPLNPLAMVQRPAALPGVRSWTIETRGGRAAITTMALSPKGDMLATGSEVGCVRLWYLPTGDLAQVIVEPGPISGLAWAPDDSALAVAAGTLRLWDPDSGELLWEAETHKDSAVSVAWSKEGGLVSGHKGGIIHLRDPATGAVVRSFVGHKASVAALAFARDGARLASGTVDRVLRIWDISSGKPIHEFVDAEPGPIRRVTWSPDGTRLASCGGRKTLSIREEAEKWQARRLEVSLRDVTDMAWSPDGSKFVFLTGLPMDHDFLQMWDGDVRKELQRQVVFPECATAIAWASDGQRVYCGKEDGGLFTYEPDRNQVRSLRPSSTRLITSVAWSPSNELLLLGGFDCHCRLWDIEAGKQRFSVPSSPFPLTVVAWSPRGRLVAAGGRDGLVKVFDAATGKAHRTLRCESWVWDAAFSPDGKLIAVGLDKGFVRLWEVSSGKEIPHSSPEGQRSVSSLAWSPEGRWLALGGRGSRIYLLDVENRETIRSWATGYAWFLLWTAKGDILITSSYPGGVDGIFHWQVPEGRLLKQTKGNLWESHVTMTDLGPAGSTCANHRLRGLSPSGTRLVTRLGAAKSIKNLKSGEIELIFCSLAEGNWLVINPQTGHFAGEFPTHETPVYVVQFGDRQENLTPAAFAARFGRKNRPELVRSEPHSGE